MPDIKVGDRVEFPPYGAGTVCEIGDTGEMTVWAHSQGCEFDFVDPQHTTLVEYAKPGVPMIAMRPDWIGMLDAIVNRGEEVTPTRKRRLAEMLAEARGEAKPC